MGSRRLWWIAVVAAWLAFLCIPAWPTPEQVRHSVFSQLLSQEMRKLLAREDSETSPSELMIRNLARYFVLYLVPSSGEELGRVTGTAHRIALGFAKRVYRAAAEEARRSGSSTIRRAQMRTVLEQLLPSGRTDYKEALFFPESPAKERVTVEYLDLEAFRDTGFSWGVLGDLGESEIFPDETALPMLEDAARLLAEAVNAYGLLILRLGGMHAREEFATHLQSPHLRQAEKTVAQRVASRAETQAPAAIPREQAHFVDVTAPSGIRYRHVSSDWIARFRRYGRITPTFSGGGVTAGDLDGDQWPDLIFCGGEGCVVFRNRRDGTFEDITDRSGLSFAGEARMALLADFDNDGHLDVFLTYARDTNRLFRNRGGGQFQDLTAVSGLERDGDISGPAIAFDYDNDGRLDIYVGNFGNYLEGASPWLPRDSVNAMANRLYRNLGGMRFADVSAEAGVGNSGWSQAVSHVDLDRDGDQDIYIANDFGRNELLLNNGDGTFSTAGRLTGSDDPFHGMNVAFSDLNRDGYADIFVTNIWFWSPVEKAATETNTLLLSVPGEVGTVAYERSSDSVFSSQDTGWSWAGLFFDSDNDGDDDLYIVNGFTDYLTFIQYRPHPSRPDQLYPINNGGSANVFFRNENGIPRELDPASGTDLRGINSRSLALLDYDRDGDLDMAVSTFHSEAHLFRNDGAPAQNHWLVVELVGDPSQGASRDAVGAQLIARDRKGLYVWRAVTGGEGYLGMSTLPVELGLGTATSVDLEILWPGMKRQELSGVEGDRVIRIHQGEAGFEVLRGQSTSD